MRSDCWCAGTYGAGLNTIPTFTKQISPYKTEKLPPNDRSLSIFDKSELFLDLRILADLVAEVIELSASNFTASNNLDLFDVRGMYGESLFDADTVGNTSYGEGFGNSAAVLRDYSALKELNSLARTLFDLVINLDGITDIYNGYIFL